jgi:C-terminal processing protease CtpA/Prc
MRISARVGGFQLGPYSVASPVVGLSLATEGALSATDNDGPLGNEILRRFKVRLDYSRQKMWLEPNAHLTDSFPSDMSGIEFDSGGDNCRVFKVTSIAENSPAAETGIQAGDEIVAIDGQAAGQFTSSEIYKLFMIEGAEHVLRLRRANESLTVRIKLRRLL